MRDDIRICSDDLETFISYYGDEASVPDNVLAEYEATLKLVCRIGGQGPLGHRMVELIRRCEYTPQSFPPRPAPPAAPKTEVFPVAGEVVDDEDSCPDSTTSEFWQSVTEGTEVIVDEDKQAVFMKPWGDSQLEVRFPGEDKNRRVLISQVELLEGAELVGV